MALITDFTDLYEYAHAELPGCPEPFFTQQILQAGRRFCEKSGIWRQDLDPTDLVDAQKEYTLSPIAGAVTYDARIDHIVTVRQNTDDGVDAGDIGALINWRDYCFDASINQLEFRTAPTVDVTKGLEVMAVLVPHLSATDLPDWLLNRYAEALVAGAISRLALMPNKLWTSDKLAAAKNREWRNGISTAKADIASDYKLGSKGISP